MRKYRLDNDCKTGHSYENITEVNGLITMVFLYEDITSGRLESLRKIWWIIISEVFKYIGDSAGILWNISSVKKRVRSEKTS